MGKIFSALNLLVMEACMLAKINTGQEQISGQLMGKGKLNTLQMALGEMDTYQLMAEVCTLIKV